LTSSAAPNGAMVKVDGLRKSYGTVEAVRGVSLEVQRGQVVVITSCGACAASSLLDSASAVPLVVWSTTL